MDTLPLAAERQVGSEPLTAQEIAIHVIAAAVWAPSVHNTQPWWFSAHGTTIRLYADPSRQLMVADPSGREMMISCGAALFTARLAMRSLGYIPETRVLPDPAQSLLVAEVSWHRHAPPPEYEQRLFDQVPRRRTHRGGFAAFAGSAFRAADGRRTGRGNPAHHHRRRAPGSSRVGRRDSRALRAARQRVRSGTGRLGPAAGQYAARRGPTHQRDGVPHTSYPARSERTDPNFPGRDFAHGREWGMPRLSATAATPSAGVVCLLMTAGDRTTDWVNAGQALQRVRLTSATCGVAAALHSQPLELASGRQLVCAQQGDRAYPQLVLRLGTVIQTAVSIRRPPASVLFGSDNQRFGVSHG